MDEAARQSSSPTSAGPAPAPASSSSTSSSSSSTSTSAATLRRPSSSSSSHHRRTGSAGTVSDHDVRSIGHSSRSSINSASASSMDSLDIDKVLKPPELDGLHSPPTPQSPSQGQGQPSTEHSYLDRETSLILKNIAGKPSHC
ncbi:hypothetical protein SKAU_G00242320 [Synaphobranchus kaupii]|uniref:Uncharacterized protein n=1 Tax=Synaphobranchus kaupii TaxID=118154 RepID=A0A9Q1F7R5_SYNKA|nr:hypothetical protein SKAU_G00242320 [Synaphobranchus kaupii]